MPRFTRTASLAVAVLVVATGAGCTSSVPGAASADPAGMTPTSAAAPAATPAEWVDKVCGAFVPLADAQRTAPKKDPQDTTPMKVQKVSAFLGTLDTAFGAAIAELTAAGPAPAAGGDVVGKLKESLSSIKTSFAEAKTKIDAADPNDDAALKETVKPLTALATLPDPTVGLAASPELDEAVQQAPKCKALSQPSG